MPEQRRAIAGNDGIEPDLASLLQLTRFGNKPGKTARKTPQRARANGRHATFFVLHQRRSGVDLHHDRSGKVAA